MSEILYYLDDFSDETMPCSPHLEAWATWLASSDSSWDRDTPASDGDQFRVSVLRIVEDIVATRGEDGWSFSRSAAGADFLAVRFGQSTGWDADTIMWGDDKDEVLRDWFADPDNVEQCGDIEYVAVGHNEPDMIATFHAGPPPSLTVEVVQ